MKVGIITYHDTKNFGSWLQAYALQKKCLDLGMDAEIIDYSCPAIEKRELPAARPNTINIKSLIHDYMFVKPYRDLYASFKNESKKYLTLSEVRYTPANIGDANDVYDMFVVGSDIVWGTHINGSDYTYFLKFADDDKIKVSYASSIGEYWNADERKTVASLLERFDRITVREREASDWISSITTKKPGVVCDPTMLITPEEWTDFGDDRPIKGKYIFVYFMDTTGDNVRDAVRLGEKLGIPVYYAGFTNKMKGVKSFIPKNPRQFVAVIKYAEVVFCGSYHGTLFSLYMNRPVYYYFKHASSRLTDLAEALNITDRFGPNADFADLYGIDYGSINHSLSLMRENGLEVLKSYANIANQDNK